jgi:hypothetical protein
MGNVYNICEKNLKEGCFASLGTDGKTAFIGVVECGGTNGFRLFTVEFMNTSVIMNKMKVFFFIFVG